MNTAARRRVAADVVLIATSTDPSPHTVALAHAAFRSLHSADLYERFRAAYGD